MTPFQKFQRLTGFLFHTQRVQACFHQPQVSDPHCGEILCWQLFLYIRGPAHEWWWKVIKQNQYTNLAFICQMMYVIFSITNNCGQAMHADLPVSSFIKLCVLIRGRKRYRSHNSERLANYLIQLWGFCSSWKLQVCPCLIISENFIEFPLLLR